MSRKLLRALQNAYEGITQTKLNNGFVSPWNAAATALFGLFATPNSFFIGNACKPSAAGSGLVVQLAEGVGIQFTAGDIWTHDYRPIIIDSVASVTFDGNSDASGDDRIDLLCIRAIESEGDSQTVEIKNPVDQSITPQTKPQRVEYNWETQIVKGAVAASPVAPATPVGWIAVAEVTIQNGSATILNADVVDVRAKRPVVFNDLRPEFLRPKRIESYGETIICSAMFSHPGGSPVAPYQYDINAGRGITTVQYDGGTEKYIYVVFDPDYRPRSNNYLVIAQVPHEGGSTPYGHFIGTSFDNTSCFLQYIDPTGALAEPPALSTAVFGQYNVAIIDLTPV